MPYLFLFVSSLFVESNDLATPIICIISCLRLPSDII